jgi:transcriptional regulator of acetoin/glycerol metabolism
MRPVAAITVLAAHDVVDLAALPRDLFDELSGTREPAHASDTLPVREATLGRVERDAISAAIVVRQGNLTQVARDLNISRSTLYLKVKKHSLDPVLDEARLGA